MTQDEVAAFLGAERRAHVATINADGTPHLVPLTYVLLDGLMGGRLRRLAAARADIG